MKNAFLVTVLGVLIFAAACKKTPDYMPQPYKCGCGSVDWQGTTYDLLSASYILSDSTVSDSRRYYFTSDVGLTGEYQTHGLSGWIEIPELDGGGRFEIDAQTNLAEFQAWVDEFNVNDPTDTLRQFVPINAVVQVVAAPVTGGTETVSFLLTMNQLENGIPVPGDVNCSGSFTVQIAP
ncbi:MAG: hypothetical protein ACKO6L_02950 [Flavobacteriales bacterium]